MPILNLKDKCCKLINEKDYVHYMKLLSNDFVRSQHPHILKIIPLPKSKENKLDGKYIMYMKCIGKAVEGCSTDVQRRAHEFVQFYLKTIHTADLFHGDLVRESGNGIHMGNILYNEKTDNFLVIDFNSNCDLETEKRTLERSSSCCPVPVQRKRKYKDVFVQDLEDQNFRKVYF